MSLLSDNEVRKCREFFNASKKTQQEKKEKKIFDSFDYTVYKFTNLLGDLSKETRHGQLQKEKYVLCLFNSVVYDEPEKMEKLLTLQKLFKTTAIDKYPWLKNVKSQLDKFLFYVELIRIHTEIRAVSQSCDSDIKSGKHSSEALEHITEFKLFLDETDQILREHIEHMKELITSTHTLEEEKEMELHMKEDEKCDPMEQKGKLPTKKDWDTTMKSLENFIKSLPAYTANLTNMEELKTHPKH